MADNPFAQISDGVTTGLQLGLMSRQRKLEAAKLAVQMKQMTEQQDMSIAQQAISALNADGSGPTTRQNSKLVLNQIFKKYAPQMGLDPSSINVNFDHENDQSKEALDGINANIKDLLSGKIHPDDFIVNMKDHLQTLSLSGVQKSVAENAKAAGDSALALATKTPETKDIEMGGQKTSIQFDPVTKKWVRVQVGAQPATQPIPAPSSDTGPLNAIASNQALLNKIAETYNPSFVGPLASRVSGAGQAAGILSPEESSFRALVAQHAQAAKAMLDQNPESAKTAPSVPDITMNPDAFQASLNTAKGYYRSAAQNHIATMIANGMNVSPEVAQASLNMPKAKPKPTARPPLESFMVSKGEGK